MDKGTWTFKCRKCGTAFELELSERERAVDMARERRCPECGLVPGEASQAEAMRGDRWHKVIGYRREKKARPQIL